jgi:hypothetical protein
MSVVSIAALRQKQRFFLGCNRELEFFYLRDIENILVLRIEKPQKSSLFFI